MYPPNLLGTLRRDVQLDAPGVEPQNVVGSAFGLPTVSDPQAAYAAITRDEYMTFLRDYRGFEDTLINQAQNDTSLIDQARQDSVGASLLTQGIAQRNQARYGAALTPAQLQQQQVRLQRANTLGTLQSVNDARLNQREANTALLSDLINIGQGLNRSSQQGLASAASNASARAEAYNTAKAQQKQSTYQTIGSLGAMAIMAMAF